MDASDKMVDGSVASKFLVTSGIVVLGGAFSAVEAVVRLVLAIISSPLLLARFFVKSAKKYEIVPVKLLVSVLINIRMFLASVFGAPFFRCVGKKLELHNIQWFEGDNTIMKWYNMSKSTKSSPQIVTKPVYV